MARVTVPGFVLQIDAPAPILRMIASDLKPMLRQFAGKELSQSLTVVVGSCLPIVSRPEQRRDYRVEQRIDLIVTSACREVGELGQKIACKWRIGPIVNRPTRSGGSRGSAKDAE